MRIRNTIKRHTHSILNNETETGSNQGTKKETNERKVRIPIDEGNGRVQTKLNGDVRK